MEADALHDLTAAYALDALDPRTRARYEAHLAHCERCHDELAELSEAAGALAYATGGARRRRRRCAPASSQQAARERPNVVPLRPRWVRPVVALAAVAACAAIGLGIWAASLSGKLDRSEAELGGPAAGGADPRRARLSHDLVLARDARRRPLTAEAALVLTKPADRRIRPHLRGVGRRRRGSRACRALRRAERAVAVPLDRPVRRWSDRDGHRGDGTAGRESPVERSRSLIVRNAASELESGACFAGNAAPARPPRTGTGGGSASSASLPSSSSFFSSASTSFTFGLITAVASQIPTCDPAHVQREVDGHIYANDGHTILATLRGSESRILVGTHDIAPIMQQAIVAVEDKRFYEHRGVDLRGIGRAVWADVTSKSVVQGGSTITQQFVKNSCVTTAANDQPQAQGGRARLAARAALDEAADPHRLSEHDLLRERRLRHPAGRTDLLQHHRVKADAPSGGVARRDSRRSLAVRSR